jgi:hypothetical protein
MKPGGGSEEARQPGALECGNVAWRRAGKPDEGGMDVLSDYLRSKAEWRRRQEKEYPNDERHERSAMAIESLADYVDGPEAPQAAIDRLGPHLSDEETLGGERTDRAVSKYGMGTHITTDHHAAFLEELVVLCDFDAYEHAMKHGDDPTHTLAEFELQAAKDGVVLPRRYFEIRQRATEDELKEAVEGHRASPLKPSGPRQVG